MRFRKRNDLCLIHLVHGVGDFGRVLLSGKTVKEVAKEKQAATPLPVLPGFLPPGSVMELMLAYNFLPSLLKAKP
jgi:hypothetical protein